MQKAAPKPTVARTPAQASVAASRISQSPQPTLDEGTIQRIAGALLGYSALEVKGGSPTLPATSARLAVGASGPELALLRRRLAITEDLPAELVDGDAYDGALAAAVRHFQLRHGLPETGGLVADARAQVANAARASGFVLQSAAMTPSPARPVSYLDCQ